MNDNESTLVEERAKGVRAHAAYNEFVKPFVEANQKSIYEAFLNSDPEDTELLSELRRMSIAINLLDQYVNTFINTGRMASMTLEEDRKNGN